MFSLHWWWFWRWCLVILICQLCYTVKDNICVYTQWMILPKLPHNHDLYKSSMNRVKILVDQERYKQQRFCWPNYHDFDFLMPVATPSFNILTLSASLWSTSCKCFCWSCNAVFRFPFCSLLFCTSSTVINK